MKSLSKLLNVGLLVPLFYLLPLTGSSQSVPDCSALNFTYTTKESRCIATGTIKVNITGGSGNYNIKVTGPVTTSFTSSTTIIGLASGSYTVTVKDITKGCTLDKTNVIIGGSYGEPRFLLSKTDVTCMNGTDGTVTVDNQQFGRAPFTYTIVAPSPSKVGVTNTSGNFSGLIAGEYAIQLKDSCGGQQTRRVTILNYQWWIDGVTVGKVGCDSAQVTVKVKDSKGNTNAGGPGFNAFKYGVVRGPGDTVWSTSSNFRFYIGKKRSVTVVIKDPCGTMQVTNWVDPNKPSVGANVTTSNFTCNTFNADVTGETNLTSPSYQLYNGSNTLITSNTTGVFTGLAYGSYSVKIKDNCYDTTITRYFSANRPIPAVDNNVNVSNKACATFTANIQGQTNLTNPTYKIYNSSNFLIATNTSGTFPGLAYGSYCIRVKDGCYDTTIERCFTAKVPKPAVDLNISTSGGGCSSYTGTITGQANLTNPNYCLYLNNVKVTCNTTGKFPNMAYGVEYCIKIDNDNCYDTVITRCITLKKPVPSIGNVTYTNQTCSTFTANVGGQKNLNDPNYCLYDKNDVKIICNTTGIFPNLGYGQYCVRISNNTACYDTVIKKCFNVIRPEPALDAEVTIGAKSCSTVAVAVVGYNLTNPKFVLYNANNVAIDSNAYGAFNAPYGNGCIKLVNTCYDTTIKRCFTVKRDVPAVGTVKVSNKACSTFVATVTGQSNLQSPTYSVYETSSNNLVTSNGNGIFTLPYGSYYIVTKDPCYDTTFKRSFAADPVPIDIAVTAKESCTFGTTDISVTFNTGNAPYNIKVLNPVGVLVTTASSSTSPLAVTGLPPLSNGQQYTVIGIDNCNVKDTALVTPKPSKLNKTKFVKSKCPSGVWANGATDIDIDATSNLGTVTPVIIKKNGNNVTINFTNNVGSTYKFVDLEPASYIVQYSVPNCTGRVYDTVDVAPYSFPGLQQSAAYQCDNNNFSVGAVVTGGCSPFSYEVIGSIPTSPSIVTSGQTSPVFTITNGVPYSLVRLRAVDACGNATLNDVNILPLANTIVSATSNCYYANITLSVDSVGNASYQWFKRRGPGDSVLLTNAQTYTIPYLLPSDTGTYISRISVNGGCLTKMSYFTVTGACYDLLPGQVKLTGKEIAGAIQLNWEATQDNDVVEYFIERSGSSTGNFVTIGNVIALKTGGRNMYAFTDETPQSGMNYYRLRFVGKGNRTGYTNTIAVRTSVVSAVSLYPNPVKKVLNIALTARQSESYKLTLLTSTGQIVHEQLVQHVQQTTIQYQRGANVKSGVYMLRIAAINSQESFVYKVVFE